MECAACPSVVVAVATEVSLNALKKSIRLSERHNDVTCATLSDITDEQYAVFDYKLRLRWYAEHCIFTVLIM